MLASLEAASLILNDMNKFNFDSKHLSPMLWQRPFHLLGAILLGSTANDPKIPPASAAVTYASLNAFVDELARAMPYQSADLSSAMDALLGVCGYIL